jgi:chorismate mutase
MANVTLSVETENMSIDLEALLDKLRVIDGVRRLEIVGQA